MAQRMLEDGGFEVVGEAADGESALSSIAALDPQLVLLDVQLPDLDGFAVAQRLAESGARAAIIMTSSRSASDYGTRLARCPAIGFIPKARADRAGVGGARGRRPMTRRAQASIMALMLVSVAGAVLPRVLRGDPISAVAIFYDLGVGVLFVIAGLLGWARRPTSAVGRLLTVAGLVWLLARAVVWAGPHPVVFTAGLVLVMLPIAFLAHLAVVFPSGRTASTIERVIVVSSYVVIISGVALSTSQTAVIAPGTSSPSVPRRVSEARFAARCWFPRW